MGLPCRALFLVMSFPYLGEPSGPAGLMRWRVWLAVLPVLLRVPVYRGLTAPHLKAPGHLPGFLRGAPAPLALPAVALQPAELAGVGAGAGDGADTAAMGAGRAGGQGGQGVARPVKQTEVGDESMSKNK